MKNLFLKTFLLTKWKTEREFVFADMGNMVIKETNGSGGYGMVMGNKASKRN
jgi:uncharacterized circularly permuted ATP-grasp superfamily protein